MMALWLLVVMLFWMLMLEEMRGWPWRCLVLLVCRRRRRSAVRSAKACRTNIPLLFIHIFEG